MSILKIFLRVLVAVAYIQTFNIAEWESHLTNKFEALADDIWGSVRPRSFSFSAVLLLNEKYTIFFIKLKDFST